MAGAISLSANNSTGDQIIRLWDAVSAFEDKPSMSLLGYPPHLTFSIYNTVDAELLAQTVSVVFKNQGKLRITFDCIRFFDASPMVLWASPKDPTMLSNLHDAIHSQIDPADCLLHYSRENWIPHCTLGTRILDENRGDALAFALDVEVPFEVTFDTVDWISFPPVEILGTRKLSPEAKSRP